MLDKEALIEEYIDDIAIISMGGRFPGADNLKAFWDNLEQGVESITFFNQEQLLELGVNPSLLENPNFVGAEGVLDNVENFDAEFFSFSPREAELLDPQHRLFLEVSWEVLEKAGYSSPDYKGAVGVYCGAGASSYLSRNLLSHPDFVTDVGTFKVSLSTGQDFVATRASYKLGLTGPSINVNTLCSSSAVAVHYAREALLAYQCDVAIAGGVTISNSREDALFYQEGGIGSFDGHCRAFDERAAGTVAGNGIALIALKRMEDAIADNDTILAVIKGTAINNDGADKASYTAPSSQGQAKVIAEALAIADVNADSISYVEAHGTGTNLGDPIEVAGLTRAYRLQTDNKQYCGIGSVKTNIGHLVSAGGVASLIKTVLGMQHRTIPANLNFEKSNPKIDFANSPFYVVDKKQAWEPVGGDKLRAGVSSFGIGGTNAHLIVEEAPKLWQTDAVDGVFPIVLSAKTTTALAMMKENLKQYLLEHGETINLADLAYTLQVGRHHFEHKFYAGCKTVEELVQALGQAGEYAKQAQSKPRDRQVCFMFPGQGSQYINMSRDLYQENQTYRAQLDVCFEKLPQDLAFDLRALMFPAIGEDAAAEMRLRNTDAAQLALFVVEYSLAKLWQTSGVQPSHMIGHSIGEYVAACLAGVFSLKDALKVVARRGQLMAAQAKGTMLSVSLNESEIQKYVSDTIWHSVQNTPNNHILSGSEQAIADLKVQLSNDDIGFTELVTSHAFHSGMMDGALADFKAVLNSVDLHSANTPFISNLDGNWVGERATSVDYWVSHLRSTVRFSDGVKTLLEENNEQLFLEVGPGHTLSAFVKAQNDQTQLVVTTLPHPRRASDSAYTYATALGSLWGQGIKLDWLSLYQGQQRRRIELPTYPFERKRYWIPAAPHGSRSFSPDVIISQTEDLKKVEHADVKKAAVHFDITANDTDSLPSDKLAALLALQSEFAKQCKEIMGEGYQSVSTGLELKLGEMHSVDQSEGESVAVNPVSATNSRPGSSTEYVSPSTKTEEVLVAHWQEVLGYSPVGIDDNFFEMGGHSLMAASIITRIRKSFSLDVPLKELLDTPTVKALAAEIDNQIWLKESNEPVEHEGEVLEL
ncbi:hypothetical protein BB427_16315 [Pseudoalteromonas sp. BMB]|uniref:type I polyketide synthase n=1 Tax=Pseudoalteromonas sp. BMB TaxID=1874619 RepID=UPI00083D34F1|nr:type I polyketide synthase [Pseudoalteromonas sp. BMB]ODB35871.1 hypothetical protein BB427_16315 [Pseudoalteromonas sp. BMB]